MFDPVTRALGLDVYEDASNTCVLGTSNVDMIIRAYDAYTGTPQGSLPLDPGKTGCFGLSYSANQETWGAIKSAF